MYEYIIIGGGITGLYMNYLLKNKIVTKINAITLLIFFN